MSQAKGGQGQPCTQAVHSSDPIKALKALNEASWRSANELWRQSQPRDLQFRSCKASDFATLILSETFSFKHWRHNHLLETLS